MNLKIMVLKKYSFEIKGTKYYKLSVIGEGLSFDFLTTEKVYNLAEINTEYLATFIIKGIKDERGKDKLCVHKIGYLKAV